MALGTLTVNLLMKTGQFETDTKRAERRAAQMAKRIDASIRTGVTVALGAAAVGFTALSAGIKTAVDEADNISKMAQKIGVSTEALSQLGYAAGQSGVEQENLQKALAKVAVDLTKNDSLLKQLGVTATTADGALIQLADKFQQMPDGLEKTAAAAKLFGERIGPDLIPLLNQGSKGINDLKDRANELGVTISSQLGKDAERFNDTMDDVKQAMSGAFLVVAQDLLPIMQDFASFMSSANMREGFSSVVSGIASVVKFAVEGAAALAGMTNAALDFFRATSDKTTSGLNIRLAELEAERDALKKRGASKYILDNRQAIIDQTRAELNSRTVKSTAAASVAPPVIGGASLGSIINKPKSTKTKSGGISDAQREAERLQQAYESLNASLAEQIALFGDKTEAEKLAYDLEFGDLSKLDAAKKQGLIVQAERIDQLRAEQKLYEEGRNFVDQFETAEERLNKEREEAVRLLDAGAISLDEYKKALEGLKTPGQQEIERLEQELSLLGLSNAERAKAAYLINNPGDNAGAARVEAISKEIEATNGLINAMDGVRNAGADAFESFLTGSASAADAFKSFADSIIAQLARIIAQQAAVSLFGDFGTAGGGSSGGLFSGLFGSLFGGGRAGGGTVSDGRFYRVNENQPEVLSYKGEDFLMMGGGSGLVKQNRGGGTANITVNVAPNTERRAANQIAQRTGEVVRRAQARNA